LPLLFIAPLAAATAGMTIIVILRETPKRERKMRDGKWRENIFGKFV
jgi:hypothetical protein